MIDGILAVDKPAGWTSHDVVAHLRRVTGQRQIGHAGTLDPLATGVLLIVLGQATKLSAQLMAGEKTYCAEVGLGATTVTDDAEAPMLQHTPPGTLTDAQIAECLSFFVGTIEQKPPSYAAIKQQGVKLYTLARKGQSIEPRSRTVTIHSIEVLNWCSRRLRLEIRCAPGTYIRALARDIGEYLEVGAYLHALRRTASGSFGVRSCAPLSAFADRSAIEAAVHLPDRALISWPAAVLDSQRVARIRQGRDVPVESSASGKVRLYDVNGRLVALADLNEGSVRPFRVFQGGDKADYANIR